MHSPRSGGAPGASRDTAGGHADITGIGKVKSIVAITLGNGLEFFDFTTYAFFAPVIGKLFFPSGDPLTQWLLAAASFGIGFVTRPLGGLVLGAYADRAGRKAAMNLTLTLMALGSLLIACAPTYASAGVAAPLLILAARLVQGFALGGEVGAATTLLLEFGGDRARGLYGSFQILSQGINSVCGALLGVALSSTLSQAALENWGWRVPFFIGVAAGLVAIYIRRHLRETLPEAVDAEPVALSKPIREVFTHHLGALTIGILTTIGGTAANYIVLYYLASYAVQVLHFPMALSLWAPVAGSALMVICAPLAGILSDRVGRKPVLAISRLLLIAAIYPAFLLIHAVPTLFVLVSVCTVLAILATFTIVPGLVLQPELFPRHVRVTGMSIVYCAGASIFGGFAQFFATLLIKLTGNVFSPSWYLIACGLLSLTPLPFLRETARRPID
uniref:MFS transporter n=1 Tax=Burkholderia anthina TaxID=179879 RepID=UPI00158F5693|nr:MFS transporter [Burkholderia anthina]